MKKKWLAVGIILLFVGTSVMPATAQTTEKTQSTSRGTWLYVGGSGPGNYTRIQDAIDNASDGDLVFVYHDSSPYYENIMINKSITLLGESRETTIVFGFSGPVTINITSDHVCLSGFKIQTENKFQPSISVTASNVQISDNWFPGGAIRATSCDNSSIMNNIVHGFSGIEIFYGTNNLVCFNEINGSSIGIYIIRGANNRITDNTIISCTTGIFVQGYNGTINNNTIKGCEEGITLERSNMIICENIFDKCGIGIFIVESFINQIINNDFFNNLLSVLGITVFRIRLSHNYYNHPRLMPKPIVSFLAISFFDGDDTYPMFIFLPWLYIDFKPASSPNCTPR